MTCDVYKMTAKLLLNATFWLGKEENFSILYQDTFIKKDCIKELCKKSFEDILN